MLLAVAVLLIPRNFPILRAFLWFSQMMAAFQDIMANPSNMAKYKDDPEIAEAFSKLTRKFGGAMPGGGMPGGFNVPQ